MMGYIPVSFTFGLLAVQGGLDIWMAVLISMTNLTSAGQFAGMNLIVSNASLTEISAAMFVINIRYMLMSLSLSQKLAPMLSIFKRSAIAFGITDEIFAIASLEKRVITFPYMMGLILTPYWGWAFGTLLGAVSTSLLPPLLQNSMGIALYAMFIALLVPAAKHSKAALIVIAIAVIISSIFKWMPVLNHVSGGWAIIISTIFASAAGAVLFPREDENIE
ncbi:AzlC family ABC transporter permease [Alkalibacter mobilis]|uniref:AzlC family ABC transporter permease n=1 Tax=Alkalibacter mobilis TaxID=2787712 RepID=UPI00189CB18D|nr:AzlC family ABC transporter permease [Alkalibacter mobilis]MBF7095691.1 AzlC family ABC transporter permease [Alkalibacter mobilis]